MGKEHGWWCGARTYPFTCKFCGLEIFHFSCDCGCSVLFEELGPPWPQHRCRDRADLRSNQVIPSARELREFLPGTIASTLSDEDLGKLSAQIDVSISSDYSQEVIKAADERKRIVRRAPQTIRQDAYHDCRTFERGIVRELILNVDIHKKAGLSPGSLGSSALSRLARDALAQITIHTGALATAVDENCSFTFFVSQATVEDAAVLKGSLVEVELRGVVLHSAYPIWVCDSLNDI